MIGVVDYGLGNIQAFLNIFKNLNIPAQAVHTCEELGCAERLILPGVGSFDWAMEKLLASGMRECLEDLVTRQRKHVLGVCVGMQMMARSSEEGKLPGLGWIPGDVKRFRGLEAERLEEKRLEEKRVIGLEHEKLRGVEEKRVRGLEDKRMRGGEEERMSLPHMGWNDVAPREKDSLFRGMEAPRFYFLHSYYFAATRSDDVLATTDYHGEFTSAVRAGNVIGTQFHPEKSHGWGIQLLKNFAEM